MSFSPRVSRNKLPLPIELLYDILGNVLSSYLHNEMVAPSGPRWDAFTTLITVCFTFKELAVDILRTTLEVPQSENPQYIAMIKEILFTRSNMLPDSRSTYLNCYHLYDIGVVETSMENLDHVRAGLRTWAVDQHQLCPGVQSLGKALKLCQNIFPRCMSTQFESMVLDELMHQLTVRQFQIWRWCLLRAFYLLPLSTADVRQDVDSAIMRLFHRVARCESMTPYELGYKFGPIILEKVVHISKITHRNLEESKLLSTLEVLSSWNDTGPSYTPSWRDPMYGLACKWREICDQGLGDVRNPHLQ